MIKYKHFVLLICLVLSYNLSLSQVRKKLIIWDIRYNCLLDESNVDSIRILDFVSHLDLQKDLVFILYYGSDIRNPKSFNFPYDPCNCSWSYENGWSFNSFEMYDSLLDSHDNWNDTICYKRKDLLPDGLWMRFVKDSVSIFCQAQKNIKNGVLHGAYKQWWSNETLWYTVNYNYGYKVDTSYLYHDDGRLSYKTMYFDSCSQIKEDIGFISQDKMGYYYNHDWEISMEFYYDGMLESICQMKKGLPHGQERFYNKKGKLYMKKFWNYGNEVKSNRRLFIRHNK